MAYKVPFINYPKHYRGLKNQIDAAIKRVLSRGDLILRSDVKIFEKRLASFVGKKYGIGVGSCTGAMFLSLYAAGIGKGDEVITVSHTYIATIDVIVHCGAMPVLVDIGEDFNMNPDLLEKAISRETKAIIPVHLNGRVCDMGKLMEIANRHNLVVIEDAAQALGARFNAKMAGSFGLTGCFSFYPAKMLGSFGDAGIIVTDDKELADKLYLLRDHGEKPDYLKSEQEKMRKDIAFFGFNSILDNIQAAVLNVKLRHFKDCIRRRREIAALYDSGLSGLDEVNLPVPPATKGHHFDVYQNYCIRAEYRDRLAEYLDKHSVETLVQWRIPNHQQKNLGLQYFHLPVTERISKEVISLPMYVELTNGQVEYVIDCVKKFYKYGLH
jgi:dTDP-4-amino-4,6-dideoxygalactose transaminase